MNGTAVAPWMARDMVVVPVNDMPYLT